MARWCSAKRSRHLGIAHRVEPDLHVQREVGAIADDRFAPHRRELTGPGELGALADLVGERLQPGGEVVVADREEELLLAAERLVDRTAGETRRLGDLLQ